MVTFNKAGRKAGSKRILSFFLGAFICNIHQELKQESFPIKVQSLAKHWVPGSVNHDGKSCVSLPVLVQCSHNLGHAF